MEDANKTKRRANFSPEEEQLLVALIEKYKGIIECKKSGVLTWKQKEDAWRKVHNEFSANSTTFRTVKNLKEKYLNLKKSTKKKFSLQKQLMRKTGGGAVETVHISDVENTLKEILDEQITGLTSSYDSDAVIPNDKACGSNKMQKTKCENQIENIVMDDAQTNENYGETETYFLTTTEDIANDVSASHEEMQSWEKYSTKDLKQPPAKKLRTNIVQHRYKTDKRYTNLNYQLIQEKIDYIKLQKEKFLEEHDLRIVLLKKQIENEELKRSRMLQAD